MSEILTKQENFAIISLQFNPSNIRKKEPATRTARTDPFTNKDSAVGNEKCLPPISILYRKQKKTNINPRFSMKRGLFRKSNSVTRQSNTSKGRFLAENMIKYVLKERRCFYGVFRKIKRAA